MFYGSADASPLFQIFICQTRGLIIVSTSLPIGHATNQTIPSGFEAIKLFSCSTQLRLKFILLKNVKMQTIVGILTFISRINY